MEWVSLPSEGLTPRYEHASFVTNSQLYVFAGANPAGSVNDVWMLNLGMARAGYSYLVGMKGFKE